MSPPADGLVSGDGPVPVVGPVDGVEVDVVPAPGPAPPLGMVVVVDGTTVVAGAMVEDVAVGAVVEDVVVEDVVLGAFVEDVVLAATVEDVVVEDVLGAVVEDVVVEDVVLGAVVEDVVVEDVVVEDVVVEDVVIGVAHAPALTVLSSSVTAPLRARSRPSTSAPVVRVIEVSARMFPMSCVSAPRVAELPT